MNVSGFTQDELDVFRSVLDRAVAEAALDIPVETMTRRLFKAANAGERDPGRLLDFVLGRGPGSAPAKPHFDVTALTHAASGHP